MTVMPGPQALSGLRRVDPACDLLAASTLRLLEHTGIGAQVATSPLLARNWFVCSHGVAFAAIDQPPLIDAQVHAAVALLDALDPLLDRIEGALDVNLEPSELAPIDDCPRLTIACAGSLLIALPFAMAEPLALRAAAVAPAPQPLPTMISCDLQGPRLTIEEGASLATGDLILLGSPLPAVLVSAGRQPITGQVALFTASFNATAQGSRMADAPSPTAEFAVPLTIRLPSRTVSAATLAALRPGVTLPLGPITEGMPVTLLVAERVLAQGELVQIGERFAVLIEDRPVLDDGIEPARDTIADPAEQVK